MPRIKRVETAAATGFVEQLRELGHNWPRIVEEFEQVGTHDFLGYTLWDQFGEPYRDHLRHFRCTVDTEGHVIGTCSTKDPRLFLQPD